MKLLKFWKTCFTANKVLTVIGTIVAGAVVVGGITAGTIAIVTAANRNKPVEVVINTETEKESEVIETEVEIDKEEYYKEELALDEDSENKELEEEVPVYTWVPIDYPYYIKVNRLMNTVTIYAKDESGAYTVPVKVMVCSVGLNNGTPLGVFQTSTKYEWRALYGNVYGQYAYRIDGPILFHSVPYMTTNKGDIEPGEYNKLGQPASLGCVRLPVADAKWLIDNCPSGTTVEIYDDENPGPLGKPGSVYVDPASPLAGWDPTDPDPANPWVNSPAPTFAGQKDQTIERGASFDVKAGVSAKDFNNFDLAFSVEGSVDVNKVGNYAITYTTVDALGKSATASVTVTVEDTKNPTLTLDEELAKKGILLEEKAEPYTRDDLLAAIAQVKPQAADGNDTATLSYDEKLLEATLQGIEAQKAQNKESDETYKVKLIATDEAGNSVEKEVHLIYHFTYVAPPSTELQVPTTENL